MQGAVSGLLQFPKEIVYLRRSFEKGAAFIANVTPFIFIKFFGAKVSAIIHLCNFPQKS